MRKASQNHAVIALIAGIILVVITALSLALLSVEASQNVMALPTVLMMPSDTPTGTPTDTATPSPTVTASSTPTATNSPTVATNSATDTETPTPTPSNTPVAVSIKIKDKAGTQARSGPGISYDIVGNADFGAIYSVEASGQDFLGYTWYLVDLSDGQPAWILGPATEVVSGQVDVTRVAVAVTIPPTPTLTPTLTLTPASALEAQLQGVPILSDITSHVRDIYLVGQKLGNHANVFAKVGDCNSVSDAFMAPLDKGQYSLGRYAPLQKAILYYKGSFARQSVASEIGFNVITVQDPFFANQKTCGPNDSPLRCEYHLMKPSIAVVMFGANDVLFLTTKLYQDNMRKIIQQSLDLGIIPVLTTFTWHDNGPMREKAMEFNMIDVSLSRDYNIPLINFWLASQYLPGHGISSDNAHLSWSVNGLIFTGEQNLWGESLRSLLTLEMLDKLRQALAG